MILEFNKIKETDIGKNIIELNFCKRSLCYSDSYQIKILYNKKKKFPKNLKKNKYFIEQDKDYNSYYNAYYFDIKCKNGKIKTLEKAEKLYNKIIKNLKSKI